MAENMVLGTDGATFIADNFGARREQVEVKPNLDAALDTFIRTQLVPCLLGGGEVQATTNAACLAAECVRATPEPSQAVSPEVFLAQLGTFGENLAVHTLVAIVQQRIKDGSVESKLIGRLEMARSGMTAIDRIRGTGK